MDVDSLSIKTIERSDKMQKAKSVIGLKADQHQTSTTSKTFVLPKRLPEHIVVNQNQVSIFCKLCFKIEDSSLLHEHIHETSTSQQHAHQIGLKRVVIKRRRIDVDSKSNQSEVGSKLPVEIEGILLYFIHLLLLFLYNHFL